MSTPSPSGVTVIEPRLDEMARMWGSGWRRFFFPAFWLVYLGQTANGVAVHAHGVGAVVGYVLIVLFAAVYLAALPMGWSGRHRPFWLLYCISLGLTAAELPFAHAAALVFCVYTAVLTVASRVRWALVGVAILTLVSGLLPLAVTSWGDGIQWDAALSVLLVSLAMFGFFKIVQSNIALAAARSEVARLAAENERSRIARDLHDLLGHSLTTITVKAGLARRLAELGETERAFTEISEVEQLSRRTLGDVRAAVSAHREVTLAGELATASEVLRAAGVISELPATVVEADPALSELFGWVVREAVTNVVRHARAEHVRIVLGWDFVEIHDDGRGGFPEAGNGLCGLQERCDAAGATLTFTGGFTGFRVRVERSPAAESPAPGPDRPGPARPGSARSGSARVVRP